MTEKQRESHDEILRALTALEDADVSESEADAACQAIARRLPAHSPRAGFAARVMYAVHQAPLPAGRLPLTARPSLPRLLAAAAIAGIAALGVAFLAVPVVLPIFARVFTLAVQVCLLFIPPLTAGLDVWAVISTAAQAIAEALTLPQMLSALAATTAVGVLSFGALARLISSQEESTNGITTLCM